MRRERGRYVRDTVPSVPTPGPSEQELRAAVAALKQAVEELLRRVAQLERKASGQ